MKKKPKKKETKEPKVKVVKEPERDGVEKPFDFGGLPERDLKKNLGCG